LNRYLNHAISFENASAAREIGLENILTINEQYQQKFPLESSIKQRELLLKGSHATDFLCLVEPYLSEALISSQNYAEIKNLADYFTGSVTSFFGFESSLNNSENQSDFLFAVSSKRGERETLVNLIENGNFQDIFRKKPEWQRVAKFASAWADPKSILYDMVLGIWFEFDAEQLLSEVPIPNIFIHPVSIHTFSSKEISQHKWLIQTALPLLTGRRLSKMIQQRITNSIQKLPSEASLFQTGIMLSRATSSVRLVIKRMHPNQIIPYLNSIGWSDETNGLSSLLDELEKYVTRIVLHIGVGEKIDNKIGIECSFYPDLYNQETRWSDFLAYLTEKGLCRPEKKSALLCFPGVEQEDMNDDFDLKSYMTAVKIPENNFSRALVRYISHVKLSYEPNYPLEAKVYSGVKLFGSEHDYKTSYRKM
jgi:hypothetical protein